MVASVGLKLIIFKRELQESSETNTDGLSNPTKIHSDWDSYKMSLITFYYML